MKSERFTLNSTDMKKWAKNALIFSGPLLLMFLYEVQKGTPAEEVIILLKGAGLQMMIDLLKKWLSEN